MQRTIVLSAGLAAIAWVVGLWYSRPGEPVDADEARLATDRAAKGLCYTCGEPLEPKLAALGQRFLKCASCRGSNDACWG